jgi:hypothetical protein
MSDDLYIEFQIVLENEYGQFFGKKAVVSYENYKEIINRTKTFYNGGFELTCDDGTFIVFPPDVVRKSILKVVKINKEQDVQE